MGNIQIVHSQSHLLFPRIILVIIGLLGLVLIIQRFLSTKRLGLDFINLKEYSFFEPNYDKLKLYGTFIALILLLVLMERIGFIPSSIISLSILNIIYNGWNDKKNIIKSIVISIIETIIVWYLFSSIFGVTLP